MTLSLSNLRPARGARLQEKRVGRGNASGKGTTAGKGTKGQRAHTGGRKRIRRVGLRRLVLSTPKLRGFKSFKKAPAEVKISTIAATFPEGTVVNPKMLAKKRLIPAGQLRVKILADVSPKKKLVIEGCRLTAAAKQQVLAAGGEVR